MKWEHWSFNPSSLSWCDAHLTLSLFPSLTRSAPLSVCPHRHRALTCWQRIASRSGHVELAALLSQGLLAPQCLLKCPCELYSPLFLVPEILDSPDAARTDREVSSVAPGSAQTVPTSPSPSMQPCTRRSSPYLSICPLGLAVLVWGFPPFCQWLSCFSCSSLLW